MVYFTHLTTTTLLLVLPFLGMSNGFSLLSRDSKLPSALSSLSPDALPRSTTEPPARGIERTKMLQQTLLNSGETGHQEKSSSARVSTSHHVPLDITSGSSTDNGRILTLVKREVSPSMGGEIESKLNSMYDPSLMVMSKRTAAALNKLILALRSFDKPSSSASYEMSMEGSKERGRRVKIGNPGSSNEYQMPRNVLQRRGPAQKDRKVYLKCFFNAVSCFRRRK